jgi:hypothetical protein
LQGTDEDDGQPYTVPGDPVSPAALASPAPRRFEPLSASWESGWPLRVRVQTCVALQALNVLVLFFGAVFFGGVPGGVVPLLFAAVALAFLLGTFNRVSLSRTARGRVRLARTWRIAFIETPAQSIRCRDYESVGTVKSYRVHFEDWGVFFILLAYAIVPGLVWWWFVLRPERFDVVLYKDHGFPDTVLFRTQERWRAAQVAGMVADVTGLPLQE